MITWQNNIFREGDGGRVNILNSVINNNNEL